jgi:hypothetical protein
MMRQRAERERGVLLQVPGGKVSVPGMRDFAYDCFLSFFLSSLCEDGSLLLFLSAERLLSFFHRGIDISAILKEEQSSQRWQLCSKSFRFF